MHTTENLSNNGWQNVGICHKIAIDKIPTKYIVIYLRIVEYSFGYCQKQTERKSVKWWCDNLSISNKTFINAIKWLNDNNFIKVNTYKGFIDGGGSIPNAYEPVFPYKIDKKYGHIKIEQQNKDKSQNNKEQKEQYSNPLEML